MLCSLCLRPSPPCNAVWPGWRLGGRGKQRHPSPPSALAAGRGPAATPTQPAISRIGAITILSPTFEAAKTGACVDRETIKNEYERMLETKIRPGLRSRFVGKE